MVLALGNMDALSISTPYYVVRMYGGILSTVIKSERCQMNDHRMDMVAVGVRLG